MMGEEKLLDEGEEAAEETVHFHVFGKIDGLFDRFGDAAGERKKPADVSQEKVEIGFRVTDPAAFGSGKGGIRSGGRSGSGRLFRLGAAQQTLPDDIVVDAPENAFQMVVVRQDQSAAGASFADAAASSRRREDAALRREDGQSLDLSAEAIAQKRPVFVVETRLLRPTEDTAQGAEDVVKIAQDFRGNLDEGRAAREWRGGERSRKGEDRDR